MAKAKWILRRENGSTRRVADDATALTLIEKRGYKVIGGKGFDAGLLPGGTKIPAEFMLPARGAKPAVSAVPPPKPVKAQVSGRLCAHCRKPLPADAKSAQLYCGKVCKAAYNKAKKTKAGE